MKSSGRTRRHTRIRKRLGGTENRPRLVVFRSNKQLYAQIVNDVQSTTVLSFSTLHKEFKEKKIKASNKDAAFMIGQVLAQKAKERGITKVCFDRAGYDFHGRIKALAEGARKGGLVF